MSKHQLVQLHPCKQPQRVQIVSELIKVVNMTYN